TYSRHIEANHKLVTVSKTQFLDSLKLDNYLLHIDGRVAIAGTDLWEVIYSKLHYEERHIMVSTKFINFGVYVYGVTNEMSYINPVNFVITNINMPCVSTLDEMLMKDEIDNDCDGKIDEEMKDNIDNDGDDKIDEDLNDNEPETANVVTSSPISEKTTMLVTTVGTTRPFQVLTMPAVTTMNATTPAEEVEEVTWHWSEWACSRKCDVSDLVRKRMCSSNEPTSDAVECPGSVSELTPGTCYLNVKCPADCPTFQWDVNCKMSCANCMTDCDKFNGTCTRCQAGYKTPEEACYKGYSSLT
uniref:Uncharacterized protein n=1 Tax=Biomphalaria glabrata TaxID=6526 RepID=A0A2C9LXU4_BIOGL